MNDMKKALKASNGITLIALVITIIVLLILAGISIAMLSGDNGVLQRATDAKTKSDEAQIKERIQLAYHSALIGGKGSYTKDSLMEELKNEFKTDYDVDDSNDENWKIKAQGQEVIIPAGEIDLSVDTTWQKVLEFPEYSYNRYELDENAGTITLRSGPPIVAENVEIKKYAVIEGKKYETKFPDSCDSLFGGSRMEIFSIDKEIDFSNVTNMSRMFTGCHCVSTLNLGSLDVSNVTAMDGLFSNCYNLTNLDVSNWDTKKVTNMSRMFTGCHCVSTLNLGSLDVSNVTAMDGLFSNCYNLTNLDVSNWDTKKVTNMQWMFRNCYSITTLDLSSWDTSNVTKMGRMFWMDDSNEYEAKLQTIYASNTFVVTKVKDVINSSDRNGGSLFGNTKNLVGGNGTSYSDISNYDVNNLIAIYGARIDTTETPGFFTAK